ncbi:MAG: ATP-binding protein, partial [Spirochaetia bacterium]|nr:ATP-binding protein [Spirochaetia bacterium]
ELIRRGYDVDTGIAGANGNSTELDFVATKAGRETAYFQVCQTVMDSAVLERELKPFRMVQDNYPKYLLTMDRIDFSRDGIKHLNIADWLLRPGQ